MSGYLQVGGRNTSIVIALRRWGAPYNVVACKVTTPITGTERFASLKWPRAEYGKFWLNRYRDDAPFRTLKERYRLGGRILLRKLGVIP